MLLVKTIFSCWQDSAVEQDSNLINHYEAGFIKKGESTSWGIHSSLPHTGCSVSVKNHIPTRWYIRQINVGIHMKNCAMNWKGCDEEKQLTENSTMARIWYWVLFLGLRKMNMFWCLLDQEVVLLIQLKLDRTAEERLQTIDKEDI